MNELKWIEMSKIRFSEEERIGRYGMPKLQWSWEEVGKLADDIKAHGLITPIMVVEYDENDYFVLTGVRRFRACKLLGMSQIQCEVVRLSDMAECVQARDLTPTELGERAHYLVKRYPDRETDIAKMMNLTVKIMRSYMKLAAKKTVDTKPERT
jgi:ParB/RepB/Spo0J family partition protein